MVEARLAGPYSSLIYFSSFPDLFRIYISQSGNKVRLNLHKVLMLVLSTLAEHCMNFTKLFLSCELITDYQ